MVCRVLACLFLSAATAAPGGTVSDPPDWAQVSEIFRTRCYNCHSATGAARHLRLDDYAAALAGGDRGVVLRPGDSEGSELMRRLRGETMPRMPFLGRPLPESEIDLISRWIDAGLPATPEK